MRRVIYYILFALLLSTSAQAQGWRGSVNGQDLFVGTAARPQIANGPTLGTAAFPWLSLYTKNIFVPVGGLFTCTQTGIGSTQTPCFSLTNTTASTVGVTAQYSPSLKFCGTAWNSMTPGSEVDCWMIENRTLTNAGATTQNLTFSDSLAGAGTFTNLGSIDSAGTMNMQQFSAGNSSYFTWFGRSRLYSPGDSLVNLTNTGNSFGLQFNAGTAAPTVTACGTGAITVPSRNGNGAFTATGAAACTVTFSALGVWTNIPHCVITATKAPTTFPYISAISTSAFTVSGMTAGDNLTVNYICEGAI